MGLSVCVWREWFVHLCVETRLCLCFYVSVQIWGVCVGRDVCAFACVYGWGDRFVCVWSDSVCVEGELGCVSGRRPGDVCVEGEIGVCVWVCACMCVDRNTGGVWRERGVSVGACVETGKYLCLERLGCGSECSGREMWRETRLCFWGVCKRWCGERDFSVWVGVCVY